jgi:uncharacterized membrane protein YeaQ/YmgE (transglycosylase-associated protein family)
MSLLMALLIGIIVGVVASAVFGPDPEKVLINCLLGLAGAILGLVIYVLTFAGVRTSLFDPIGLLADTVGALLFVTAFNFLHRAAPDTAGRQNLPASRRRRDQ